MYQNNNLPSVEKLIQRLNAAEKSQQREIRISIQEAKDLTQELALLTTKMGNTVQEIHQLLLEMKANSSKIDVKFDGGTF